MLFNNWQDMGDDELFDTHGALFPWLTQHEFDQRKQRPNHPSLGPVECFGLIGREIAKRRGIEIRR